MAKLTKEYKNLLFDLFYDGFDLVYGSTGEFPWYAALIKDCEEDIDVVDWSKVAVDTPILVRSSIEEDWNRRHFAKYKDGKVCAWSYGKTSWSGERFIAWEHAKLAE